MAWAWAGDHRQVRRICCQHCRQGAGDGQRGLAVLTHLKVRDLLANPPMLQYTALRSTSCTCSHARPSTLSHIFHM